MTPIEANAARWDQSPAPFYEVWYVIAVEPTTGDGFWIRYTLLNPGRTAPRCGAAVWFAHTCRAEPARSLAIAREMPSGCFQAQQGSLDLCFGSSRDDVDCVWRDRALSGRILARDDVRVDLGSAMPNEVHWDLEISDDTVDHPRGFGLALSPGGARAASAAAHLLLPAWLRRYSDRRSSLTIPYPKLRLNGRITIDGRALELRDALGHQAHHWGRERAEAWDWAHCAHFEEDPYAIFEALTPHLAGGRLRPTFVRLHTRNAVYDCDHVLDVARARCAAGLGWWRFVTYSGATRIEAEISAPLERFTPFTYLSTTLAPSRCWNTQSGDCVIRILEPKRDALVLHSRGLASAEMHRAQSSPIPYERTSA